MVRATFQGSEAGDEDDLLDYQIAKTIVGVNPVPEQGYEKSYALLRHRTKEASVDAGSVVAVGKSTMRVEEVASGAQDPTGTTTMLKGTSVADIKIVPTIKVREKAIANSGIVRVG